MHVLVERVSGLGPVDQQLVGLVRLSGRDVLPDRAELVRVDEIPELLEWQEANLDAVV